ncbi:MAG: TolB family protein, partial [Actinomycetota bacterium]
MTAKPQLKLRSFLATVAAAALGLGALAAGTDALRITPATYSGTNGPLLYYKTSGFGMNMTSSFAASSLDGAALTPNFTATGSGIPEISADGTKAVWLEQVSSAWAIKMVNTNGSSPVTIASGSGSPAPSHPSFSPDGTKIAVSYDRDVHIINAAASQSFSVSTTVVDSTGGMNSARQPQYISATKIIYIGTQAG